MRNFFRNFARERRANTVIKIGEKINKLYGLRYGLEPEFHADEIQRIDFDLNRLERRKQRLLSKISHAAYQGGTL